MPAKRTASKSSTPVVSVKTVLFDADQPDHAVDLSPAVFAGLKDHQLLWVDATGPADAEERRRVIEVFPVDTAAVDRFLATPDQPGLELRGDSFMVRVLAMDPEHAETPTRLALIAGRNYVVSLATDAAPFMAGFHERLTSDTSLGEIDSADFVAVMLDGLLTGYLAIADGLEAQVDGLDAEALLQSGRRDLLSDLVGLRHRIAVVRRGLTAHRELFAAIARPDFEIVAGTQSNAHYQALAARFERAIDALDVSRDALVGTFDIHASRVAQRTNDIVKILTTVSVLLLPTTVVAGFMGMNIKAPYSFDDPGIFWFVVILLVSLAVGTLVVMRARKWL